MSNIWFASDFHFGHTNIAGKACSQWSGGYRTFNNVREMNQCLTDTINKYVKEDDILYFLGDFCFGGHKNTPAYRSSIACKTIHLCRGNHDGHIDLYKDHFTSIQDTLSFAVPPFNFFLSHYAHRIWLGSHKGYVHLYGHSHDSIPDHGKSMDVGVDVAHRLYGEYRPFSFDEIVQIMNKKQIAFTDKHNPQTNVR